MLCVVQMLASTLSIWKNGYKDSKRRYMSILSGELWHALPLWLNDLKCTLLSVLWTKKETAWMAWIHVTHAPALAEFLLPLVLLPRSFSVNASVLAFGVPSPPIQFWLWKFSALHIPTEEHFNLLFLSRSEHPELQTPLWTFSYSTILDVCCFLMDCRFLNVL